MNAVGIDVSKGKSTVASCAPAGKLLLLRSRFLTIQGNFPSSSHSLKAWTAIRKSLWSTQATNLPVALFLQKVGLFFSVVTPILVKDYSNKSLTVRKGKTDKKDSIKLAAFALDRWNELPAFSLNPPRLNSAKPFIRSSAAALRNFGSSIKNPTAPRLPRVVSLK